MTSTTTPALTPLTPAALAALTERWHQANAVLMEQVDGRVSPEEYDTIWRVVFEVVGDDVGTLLAEVARLQQVPRRQRAAQAGEP